MSDPTHKGYRVQAVLLKEGKVRVMACRISEGWVVEDTEGHELNLRGQWVGTGAVWPTLDEAIAAWERMWEGK